MRKAAFLIITMFFTLGAIAQGAEPAQKTFWDDPVNDPLLPADRLCVCGDHSGSICCYLSYQDSQHAGRSGRTGAGAKAGNKLRA